MPRRTGSGNYLTILAAVGLSIVVVFGSYLYWRGSRRRAGGSGEQAKQLLLYCAAGMRYPMEQIVNDYQRESGVRVQVQWGGSGTLLSKIEIAKTGDLYLAADDSYTGKAAGKGLAREQLPLAKMRPVIAVKKSNTSIKTIEDLLDAKVRVGLGNPDAAAVGRKTRKLLKQSKHWERLNANITDNGVFKPTVNEIANDVKTGALDAGIIWDSTCAQYEELKAIRTPELDAGTSNVTICVLTSTEAPTAALRFARYVAARDRGLKIFKEKGFEVVEGDVWEPTPEITFYSGSVNRLALEPILEKFQRREGVLVNTVYNGCGILTSQMKIIRENQDGGFPDAFMACDVYYLNVVQDWFAQGTNISGTEIVIVVPKGNPRKIKSLADLAKPGTRVAIGQPRQCTIGVLTKRLLEDAGIYKKLFEQQNIVAETDSSARLVPTITTRSADAALAYITDTRAEADKLEIVHIDSPLARAVQPFSIARSSEHKHLCERLFRAIAASRDNFERAGFLWLLKTPANQAPAQPTTAAAPPPVPGESE